MPSGSAGPSGVAESPETAAGRRGQTADPGVGPETSGKAGAGPLGKAASAGTEATAAEAAVTSVTAVTSAPAAAVTTVTEVTSAVPGPKGLVAGPSGAAGSGTTPEDNRPVCLEQFMETIHLVIMNESLVKAASAGTEAAATVAAVTLVTAVTSAPEAAVTTVTAVTSAVPGPKGPAAGPNGAAGSGTTPEDNRPVCLKQLMETIHLVIMNESLVKAASAGTEAAATVAAVTLVTAVTSAPEAAVTAVTAVTSAVPGPKGPVARPNGVVGSGTIPEDNRPVKILLNLRRKFTAYKGSDLKYGMTVKWIKFKLIQIKAWTLGSWLIERLNSLQACRTSRSCGRFRQVVCSVFRKKASWIWEAFTVKVSRCSSCPILRWIHRRCRNRCDSVDRRGRWTHRRGWWTHRRGRWTHRRCQDSVDHLSWLRNLTRSWTRSTIRFGSLETIRLVIMNSFKTRTFWFWIWFRTFWLRLNRGEVVVDNNVVGGEMVDDERSGSPETTCWLMNSFKTRTFWFGSWSWTRSTRSFRLSFKARTSRVRFLESEVFANSVSTDSVADRAAVFRVVEGEKVDDKRSGFPETTRLEYRGEVVVDDSVVGGEMVDDERSGFPETTRLEYRGEVVVDDSVVGGEMVDDERSGSLETICLLVTNRGEVVVNDNVVGGEMVDNERSGFPETICLVVTNRGEVVVNDNVVGGEMVDNERSGFPETSCLFITNSFKTRTFWFRFRTFWLRLYRGETRTLWLNRGEVVVADNVNAVAVVDDDQSGLPEFIRLDNELLASFGEATTVFKGNIILNDS